MSSRSSKRQRFYAKLRRARLFSGRGMTDMAVIGVYRGAHPLRWGSPVVELPTADALRKEFGAYSFEPEPDPLYELALEYYRRTEAYDRTVCTGPFVDGCIMPASYKEQALVSRNAISVLRELQKQCGDPAGLLQAMRRACMRYGSTPFTVKKLAPTDSISFLVFIKR